MDHINFGPCLSFGDCIVQPFKILMLHTMHFDGKKIVNTNIFLYNSAGYLKVRLLLHDPFLSNSFSSH